jgi:AraC-like DNA-binding protein
MSLLWQPFPLPPRRRAQAWLHHPAFRRPAHLHDEPEFNLVVRGRATFVVGQRRIAMSAGMLLWYPPGVDHYLEQASDDLELYVVGFSPELLVAFKCQHGSLPNFARPLERVDAKTIRTCVETFNDTLVSVDHRAVEQRLIAVLMGLASACPRPTLGYRAVTILAERPTLRRDELVRRLASNRGDVSRQFHSELGMTLTEYKNRLQTLRLISLLESGQEANLTRAALGAGFGSYSRCHQVIRSLLGCSPRDLLEAEVRYGHLERFEPMLEKLLVAGPVPWGEPYTRAELPWAG